ncbi:MAG TPA: hypothetical protein VKT53_07780 [Candidatus Acidoferrum sp.]|nr:hypothetical protein [Candidatus Acidoferrum sp.]
MSELDLPPFSLDVETLDLGPGVKAIGMELIETESREPVRGADAVAIWSGVFPALTAQEPFVLDFFSHLDRVRDFCNTRKISYREAAGRCLVLPQPTSEQLRELLERFEGETFGLRVGAATTSPDSQLEGDLSKRGLDAYQAAYTRYTFCAVCELEDGWLTILSETLWPTEAVRRVRPAVQPFDVHIARPN